MALNAKDTPALFDAAKLDDPKQPVEQVAGSTAKTAFVNIDLSIAAPTAGQKADGQKAAAPMTAVFAPDPSVLGAQVDLLVWFHGWKRGSLDGVSLPGRSIQQYMNHPKFKLRDFVLKNTKGKKKFLLVAPTLGDRSQFGVLNQEDQFAAFLQQAVNAAKTHLGANVEKVGDIVIGAHSGGGLLLSQVVNFNGKDFFQGKIKDVWCVDSTYQSGNNFATWAAKTPESKRLFVFSTGKYGHAAINPATMRMGADGNPIPGTGTEFEVSKDHPAVRFPHETAYDAKMIFDFATTNKLQNVEVRINHFYEPAHTDVDEAELGPFSLPKPFPFPIAVEHNQSVGIYFTPLVDDSAVLK
jgi:hypothetical protein